MTPVRLLRSGLVVSLILFGGCASQPTQLYRQGASHQDFMNERDACIKENLKRVSGARVNSRFSHSSEEALSSRKVYTSCREARGWPEVERGGFAPAVLVPMAP